MCHTTDGLIHSLLHTKKDFPRALAFHRFYLRLLSLFDDGLAAPLAAEGQVFCATSKMMARQRRAEIFMKLNDKPGCLGELEQFFALADPVRTVARSTDFHLSARNAYFVEATDESIMEESMSEVFPERVLGKYEAFLHGEKRFERLKAL